MWISDHAIRKWRRRLWRVPGDSPGAFHALSVQHERVTLLIRLFYLLNFFIWSHYLIYWDFVKAVSIQEPVWAIPWVDRGNSVFYFGVFYALNLAAAVIGIFLYGSRWARVTVFLSLFFLTAFFHSDFAGWKRLNNTFCFPLIAFLFIFLPDARQTSRRAQWRTSVVFVLAQITLLSTYGSTAIWRLRESILSWVDGGSAMVGWQGTAQAVALHYRGTMRTGVLGDFLIQNLWFSGPLMFLVTAVELLSVTNIVFRPYWYRSWGLFSLCLHFGVILGMGLDFRDHEYLVILFLACSPYVRRREV